MIPQISHKAFQRRIDGMPMLKLFLPFAVGVALAAEWSLPMWLVVTMVLTGGALACMMRSTVALLVATVAAGWLTMALHELPMPSPTRSARGSYRLYVEEDGVRRGDWLRAEGRVEAWRNPETGRWHRSAGRVLVRADTTLSLQGGSRLLFSGRIYPFRNGTPAFLQLMHRRGYRGSCYLTPRSLLEQEPAHAQTLHLRAARRMRMQCDTTQAGAVVRAMTVGDRSGISTELRAAYARSGMSHLLAVSGLHTGIVFALINAVLWWLPLVRRGHLLRNLLAVVALWLFVASAGFPPSAIRAAVMCTLLQGALASSSSYRAMNAWAAAALGMLLWNPLWLFDIGFQLSFVAVAAILLWGVPLCRRWYTRWRIVNYLVHALIIGLCASLATAPLSAYTFGVLPLVGLLLNPGVVLLGSLVVGGGLLLLLLPPFGGVLSPVVLWLAAWQNQLAVWIADLSFGASDYTPSGTTVVLLYLLFVAITVVGWSMEPKKSVHLSS